MLNRRDACLAAAGTLSMVAFAKAASGVEIPTDGNALLSDMAGKLKTIAANDAVRFVYSNLAFAQLDYRIAINLLGYEKDGDFRRQAYAVAEQVLFNEQTHILLLRDEATPSEDLIKLMADAYDSQREQYKMMLERMFSEGGGFLAGLTPTILVQSMAYFAVASAVVYQSVGDWFTKSYVFPFCVKSATSG